MTVTSVIYSPDGEFLASGRRMQNNKLGSLDSTIRLWEVNKGNNKQRVKGKTVLDYTKSLSPGSGLLASSKRESLYYIRFLG